MIIHKEKTIRTDVENLFLSEMVLEDRKYLVIGEGDDSIIDDMTSDIEEYKGVFEYSDEEEPYDIEKDTFYNKYGI